MVLLIFFFQAEDGIRHFHVTGVQTCALPIYRWDFHPKQCAEMGIVRHIPALFRPTPPAFQRFDQINLCQVIFEIHPNNCDIFMSTFPKIKTRKINNFHTAYFVLSIKTNLRKLYKMRNTQNLTIPKQDTLKQLFTGVNRKILDILAYRRLLRIFESYVPFLNDNANRYRQTNEFT